MSSKRFIPMIACVSALGLLASPLATAGELRFSVKPLTIDSNEGCDVADVDGDGRLDVIAGRNWYAAPYFIPRPLRDVEIFFEEYSQTNGDHALDVNGDGRTDVVSVGFMLSKIHWFENPGSKALNLGLPWPKHTLIDTGLTENEASFLHDIDGDGTRELIVNSWKVDNPMCIYRFTTAADGKPALKKVVIGPKANGHGIGFGDINGDGRRDVLFGGGWYEQPASDPFGQHWKLHRDWTFPSKAPHASCPMIVTDLTGDGRNDIIWGEGHDYGLFWEEQLAPSDDGSLRFKNHVIDKSLSQAHCLHYTDLDGDGVPELITGKRVRAHNGNDPGADDPYVLYYYRFDRAAKTWARHTIDDSGHVGTGLQIRTADLNADGRLDIVVAGKSGTYILTNEGN